MGSKYTSQFKQDAVKLAVESDQSIAQTARNLGVVANSLYTWIKKYHHPDPLRSRESGEDHPFEELKRLR